MNDVIYILLRRLRAPLITLIVVYAASVLGLVLIPGVDDQGQPWRMDFFHAFYFVSFMGSTIGFGEVPYPFTDGQRFWTLACIYATVIAWLYSIGTLLTLLQEPAFGRLMRRRSFVTEVLRLREPFYLICGYGVTGSQVVKKLAARNIRTVVLDLKQERIDALEMDGLSIRVPRLCADASLPDVLHDAGLRHQHCIGVLALTNDDQANLAIAIASKVLVPERMVISRTESDVTTANLDSFGTNLVVDPFRSYAEYLVLTTHAPYTHLVYDWLLNPLHRHMATANKRMEGRWIICGYGRFGRALCGTFRQAGVELTLINEGSDDLIPPLHRVRGIGTEAVTLQDAGVGDAVGIVAGTFHDADNLSIIMTARALNPKLITVVRQNLGENDLVFQSSRADFVMEPGRIIANRILAQIKTPLLPVFIERMLREHDDVWAHVLLNRMSHVVGDRELDSWGIRLCQEDTPALLMRQPGQTLKLRTLMKDPRDRTCSLACLALMHRRGTEVRLLPGELCELQEGDELLFCGLSEALHQMEWTVNNYNLLQYLLTGRENSDSLLSRLLNPGGRR
ncbi:potassium channel family protein [Marinobacterium sedimentorum]|uniref:potassium channel family protein n=1 Tax=Marinobacterium sedimentorum TaxID=2927804 RepID=UPI0020C653CA|nr:NAD-binding protein [Marinobacterium sedimentorum]MCP8689546.1 NAD-binding protein [Marinobacterium sedimentorum]